MSLSYSWPGVHETPTIAARIGVRSTTDGVLTAVVDGVTFTGTTLATATNDGHGTVDITGLSANTLYTATLYVAGVEVGTQKTKTWPTDSLKVAVASCTLGENIAYWAVLAKTHNPDVIVILGDGTYSNEAWNPAWVIDTPVDSGTACLDVATYAANHQRERNNPGWKVLMAAGVPVMYIADDHEWAGDNVDHTPAQGMAGGADMRNTAGVSDPPTQPQVDAMWWAGRQALIPYYATNPANPDAAAVPEKPPNADAGTSVNQYPVSYTRVGNNVAELFLTDCMSHRSPLADTDDASKTMYGAVQKQWRKDQVKASTSTFKIILTGKYLFEMDPAGGDRWNKWSTERDEILDYDRDEGVTSVIYLAGDVHHPNVAETSIARGDAWDAVCLTCCPCGQPSDVDLYPTGLGPYTRSIFGNIATQDQVFGIADITADRCTLSLVRQWDARVIPIGYIEAGSSVFARPAQRFGIG